MVQLRSEKTSEADRGGVKKQLQTLETKIKEHIDLTKRQQDEIQEKKRVLEEESRDEEDRGTDRELAIQEVEKQSHLLKADQESCGVVLSQVWFNRSGQEITNVLTLDNSKAQVGMPESVVGRVNQRITDIRTEGGSTAYVGIF
jgi:hypothetical protein